MTSNTIAAPDGAIAFSIPEAVRVSGLSRTRLYQLAGEGKIRPRKFGKRTVILAAELRALIDAAPAAPIRVRAPTP